MIIKNKVPIFMWKTKNEKTKTKKKNDSGWMCSQVRQSRGLSSVHTTMHETGSKYG